MAFIIKYYAKTIGIVEIENGIKTIEEYTNERLDQSINDLGVSFKIDNLTHFVGNDLKKDEYERNIPLITNAIENSMILFSGYFLTHTTYPNWYLLCEVEKEISNLCFENLFSGLTYNFDGYWAKASPSFAEGKFFDQGQPDYNPTSAVALPKLPLAPPYDSPYIPSRLGWLNYWPAPTLKRINFQEQHRALFHRVQPAANGGLILQITKEPLDLDNAGHLRKTVAIYDALPAIGGRDCV